ncbi:MAG: Na/Pi symporter [Zoogloeaceae bacterium]|nr:Na/Pi symporter [Zoogloeaceae bacterium]
MSRQLAFIVLCLLLGYGLWSSPDFKEIAAGVAIFLFGMLALEQGFKTFTGGMLERILQFSTNRLWKSVIFGMVTTTLMQSSSLVSVISISFLSAGLLGLAQGIGIIFGANLGSTTGAWLVAGFGLKVDIAAWAMPMLVFGVILQFTRSAALKGGGQILLGLGFLFLGIAWMKDGFEAFGQSLNMADYAMSGVGGLLLFTLFGILATVVMQSSHATLVLTIAALATGQVTYENALALAIGANVGTTITALLGSLGANEPGRRLAAAHLIFNVTTGLVALLFISVFVEAVEIGAAWLGIEADDWTLKLALFHTLFNLAGLAILLPLTGRLVRWLERLIPQKTVSVVTPKFLARPMLEMPDAGLEAARKELQHLFANVFDVMALALHADPVRLRRGEDLHLLGHPPERVRAIDIDDYYQRRVKPLYGEILDFLAQLRVQGPQSAQAFALRGAGQHMVEALKDLKHMQKNLVRYLAAGTLHPREEYVAMRRDLALLLHALHRMSAGEEADIESALAGLQSHAEHSDLAANGTIDGLMRERRIGPEQASSLMNDNTYAADITRSLVAMAHVLFAPGPAPHPLQQELQAPAPPVLDGSGPQTSN